MLLISVLWQHLPPRNKEILKRNYSNIVCVVYTLLTKANVFDNCVYFSYFFCSVLVVALATFLQMFLDLPLSFCKNLVKYDGLEMFYLTALFFYLQLSSVYFCHLPRPSFSSFFVSHFTAPETLIEIASWFCGFSFFFFFVCSKYVFLCIVARSWLTRDSW